MKWKTGLVVTMVFVAGGSSGAVAANEVVELESVDSTSSVSERDRGPTTMTTGATGRVEIEDFFIGGVFFAGDTILRAKAHPECVAHLEPAVNHFSDAGVLSVRGPAASFEILPDARAREYFEFPDLPLFNFPDAARIRVSLSGAPGFPPIEPTILHAPAFDTIEINSPSIPADGSLITVSSDAPFKFKWVVPDLASRSSVRKQQVSARLLALGPVRWAQLYCTWPIGDGRGKFPQVMLRAIRAQLGGTGALDGNIDMYAGEFREIRTPTSSYVVFVTTEDATSFPRSTSVLFD